MSMDDRIELVGGDDRAAADPLDAVETDGLECR